MLASTVTLASAWRRTIASDTEGPILAFIIIATPRPRSAASSLCPSNAFGGSVQTFLELPIDGRVAGHELLAVAEQVLPPKIDGVVIEAASGLVDERFESPGELRHAKAPEGAAWGRVGVDGVARGA